MKHFYLLARPLLAVVMLVSTFSARAQQAWRPFRPGLIYAFSGPGSNSALTLRLDSAYVTASGDSAWGFRRIVKLSNGGEQSTNPFGVYRKSRNNLFGARLLWQRNPAAFVLENVAEGGFQPAFSLQLRPQAPVGSTWVASSSPSLTATLTSRSWQPVNNAAGSPSDSVAVITLSTGQVVRLSRSYGLLQGPQWLSAVSTAPQWTQARLPMTLSQSPYNPTLLFNFQPGDEMGYFTEPFTISPFPSSESYTFRRILSRQLTTDSLVFTYQEQTRTNYFATPTGGTASTEVYPIYRGRWAVSLQTGKSAQFPALPLLTGEYVNAFGSQSPPLLVGRGILMNSNGNGCAPNGLYLGFIEVFPGPGFSAPVGQYSTGVDIGWRQNFSLALGLGVVSTADTRLIYYRRTLGTGIPITCGSPLTFTGLLPTRAAAAADVATLHPNPATDAAVLTLAQPARAGQFLRLTDALGRTVWNAPVSASQTTVAVPLAGRPAGLYLLHLSSPDATATWKLTHE
ncbi:T9SS type A sorting domain-containing protein [Hymenobacter sp. BT523]|uniref:T9SS type A sorting domain-containing protein n=1 Tax=Hymenobacter sp. BT523 TaxID=2795725 RepID=UPI0018EB3B9C|nr:T9SS type A sorting domain-containing protein [Hymenobacter sp. BT523]MBJ6108373.1 T9SS type A sorting domain-containing protein [Hymenobacter sp. BT523]